MAAEPETRIKVFVSYSRADKAFASDLVLGLAACGFAPYIDRQDIAPGEDWEKRLQGLISEADSIVYVVSPDSLASENCAQEFRQALELRKRILPVVWRAVYDAAAPPEMKRLNYIFFSGEGRTFAAGLAELAAALRTDIGWIREHTRLAELSGRWAARGRPASMLLRGDDIDAATDWLDDKPITAPAVTDDQADFIKASSDARAEAERRAKRARAGLLAAVSLVAVVFAGLAGLAAWQWSVASDGERRVTQAYGELEQATGEVRSANLRLGAEIWLRTAPSANGYYVVDSGWYPVAANYSGAIARVERSGGGHSTWQQTGFIIDGGMVHPRYANEPLLVLYAETPMISARPLVWQSASSAPSREWRQPPQTVPDDTHTPGTGETPRILTPDDTVPADNGEAVKILDQQRRDEERRAREARNQPPGVAPASPDDTFASDDPENVQRIVSSDEIAGGPETITVAFPVLGRDAAPLTASEMVWETPVHLGGEHPFQIWRLNAKPPFGWRAIGKDDVDCQPFDGTPRDRNVAMLGIAIPAEGGPSPNALALNISQLLNRETPQSMFYTHSTNKASGGAPVFDLSTGDVFAVHVKSAPDPDRPGFRRGEGYSLRHLLDMARSSIDDPQLGPVCD
jgi:hypothetical protein